MNTSSDARVLPQLPVLSLPHHGLQSGGERAPPTLGGQHLLEHSVRRLTQFSQQLRDRHVVDAAAVLLVLLRVMRHGIERVRVHHQRRRLSPSTLLQLVLLPLRLHDSRLVPRLRLLLSPQ